MRILSTLLAFALLLVLAGCSGGHESATAPSALGDGTGRAGLLGAPPVPVIGPGAGTGTQPADPNSCPTLGPAVNANQNNTKLEGWLAGPLPANVRHVEWRLLSNSRQEVARGVSEPGDPGRGRGFVFYPRNGGVYFLQARLVFPGCAGGWGETQTSFNKAPDNPDPPKPAALD